jgi:hypothetical protein
VSLGVPASDRGDPGVYGGGGSESELLGAGG